MLLKHKTPKVKPLEWNFGTMEGKFVPLKDCGENELNPYFDVVRGPIDGYTPETDGIQQKNVRNLLREFERGLFEDMQADPKNWKEVIEYIEHKLGFFLIYYCGVQCQLLIKAPPTKSDPPGPQTTHKGQSSA